MGANDELMQIRRFSHRMCIKDNPNSDAVVDVGWNATGDAVAKAFP